MIDWPSFLSSNARLDFWTIVVGATGNACCAILGCFLVLRRMSLLGDAVSHAILAGIAVAFLLTGSIAPMPMFLGAMTVGLLTALLTQTLSTFGKVPEDSSMGVVFTSLFAIGVLIISSPAMKSSHLDDCILVGVLDMVSLDTTVFAGYRVPHVLLTLVPMLFIILLFVTTFWKELKIASFDPQLATTMGISALLMHYLLMGLVAATTVATLESVGTIVVVAMLIVPAATAHLLTDRLGPMIGIAVLLGITSAVIGCLWARWANSNAAGLMAVATGLQFSVAVVLAPRHGLLSKAMHNFRLSIRIVSEDIIAMLYRREEQADHAEISSTGTATREECLSAAGGGWLANLALPWLSHRGRIAVDSAGQWKLTFSGRQDGESLVRSHRLWESYLDQHFDLPADHLHEPAEQIEHFIGPELQDKLASELKNVKADPHGRRIPPATGEE